MQGITAAAEQSLNTIFAALYDLLPQGKLARAETAAYLALACADHDDLAGTMRMMEYTKQTSWHDLALAASAATLTRAHVRGEATTYLAGIGSKLGLLAYIIRVNPTALLGTLLNSISDLSSPLSRIACRVAMARGLPLNQAQAVLAPAIQQAQHLPTAHAVVLLAPAVSQSTAEIVTLADTIVEPLERARAFGTLALHSIQLGERELALPLLAEADSALMAIPPGQQSSSLYLNTTRAYLACWPMHSLGFELLLNAPEYHEPSLHTLLWEAARTIMPPPGETTRDRVRMISETSLELKTPALASRAAAALAPLLVSSGQLIDAYTLLSRVRSCLPFHSLVTTIDVLAYLAAGQFNVGLSADVALDEAHRRILATNNATAYRLGLRSLGPVGAEVRGPGWLAYLTAGALSRLRRDPRHYAHAILEICHYQAEAGGFDAALATMEQVLTVMGRVPGADREYLVVLCARQLADILYELYRRTVQAETRPLPASVFSD